MAGITPSKLILFTAVLIGACNSSSLGDSPLSSETDGNLSEAERLSLTAECLSEEGVSAWMDGPVLMVDYATGRMVDELVADCMDEVEARYPREYLDYEDPADLEQLYRDELETRACLVAEGYEIPSPPSLDAFIELRTTENSWLPYRFVPRVGQAEWHRLNEVCPQSHPSDVRIGPIDATRNPPRELHAFPLNRVDP